MLLISRSIDIVSTIGMGDGGGSAVMVVRVRVSAVALKVTSRP